MIMSKIFSLTAMVRGKLPNRLTFPLGKLRLVPCYTRNANECIAEKIEVIHKKTNKNFHTPSAFLA